MFDYQQRVVDEKSELDKKISSLMEFIATNAVFLSLPVAEQNRLNMQYVAMKEYSIILGQRISAFGA